MKGLRFQSDYTAELADALSSLVTAFGDVDEMLDAWASSGPEGMTKDERRRQRKANAVRDEAMRLLDQVTNEGP